jgi:hypothetical protein
MLSGSSASTLLQGSISGAGTASGAGTDAVDLLGQSGSLGDLSGIPVNAFPLSANAGQGGGQAQNNYGLNLMPVQANFLDPTTTSTYNPTVTANPTVSQGVFGNSLILGPQIAGPNSSSAASLFGGAGDGGGAGGGNIADNITYAPSTSLSLPGVPGFAPMPNALQGGASQNIMTSPNMMPNTNNPFASIMNTSQPIAGGGVSPMMAGMMGMQQQQQAPGGQQIIPGTASQAGRYDPPMQQSPMGNGMPGMPQMPQLPTGMSANPFTGSPNFPQGFGQPQMAPQNAPGSLATPDGRQVPFNQATASAGAAQPSAPGKPTAKPNDKKKKKPELVPPPPPYQPSLVDAQRGGADGGDAASDKPDQPEEKSPEEYRADAAKTIDALKKQLGVTDPRTGKLNDIHKAYLGRQHEIDKAQDKAIYGTRDEKGNITRPSMINQLRGAQLSATNKELAAAGIAPVSDPDAPTTAAGTSDTPEPQVDKADRAAEEAAQRRFLRRYPADGMERLERYQNAPAHRGALLYEKDQALKAMKPMAGRSAGLKVANTLLTAAIPRLAHAEYLMQGTSANRQTPASVAAAYDHRMEEFDKDVANTDKFFSEETPKVGAPEAAKVKATASEIAQAGTHAGAYAKQLTDEAHKKYKDDSLVNWGQFNSKLKVAMAGAQQGMQAGQQVQSENHQNAVEGFASDADKRAQENHEWAMQHRKIAPYLPKAPIAYRDFGGNLFKLVDNKVLTIDEMNQIMGQAVSEGYLLGIPKKFSGAK